VLGGGGSVKADQWRNLLAILLFALFYAWNINGELPNEDAPLAPPRSNIAKAEARADSLLASRWKAYLKSLGNVTPAQYASVDVLERNRNFRDHYECCLLFSAGIRSLTTRSITPLAAKRGTKQMSSAYQEWARMNVHLVPYSHLLIHLSDLLLRYGPGYSWHCYPYERHNGTLGKFKHNGHSGGELEATIMRSWWKSQLITGLVNFHSIY